MLIVLPAESVTNYPNVINFTVTLSCIKFSRVKALSFPGKKVTVLIGDPIDFGPHLATSSRLGHSPLQIRKSITDILQDELEKLKLKTSQLHMKRLSR